MQWKEQWKEIVCSKCHKKANVVIGATLDQEQLCLSCYQAKWNREQAEKGLEVEVET